MKVFFNKLPLPIAGVALALAALGNLFKLWQLPLVANCLASLASVIVVLIVLKCVISFEAVKADFKNPLIVAVTPTFTMCLLILATYLVAINGLQTFAQLLWIGAIVLEVGLIVYFTYRFVFPWQLTNVYPSWFVLYIGIGVIAITSPAFYPTIGHVFLWIGLALYVVLLPLVLTRIYFTTTMPEPTMPLIGIITAPASLCLAGYLTLSDGNQNWLAYVLLALAQLLYVFVLVQLPKILRLPFYPSYAALTFPFVISATACMMSYHYLVTYPWMKNIAMIETAIACVMVGYVLVRYVLFLATAVKRVK